ncbi:MAG: hypothetical protein QNL62_24195 [Gammaproteobacteria bacterium]|nr:hypothetical protein [Gammaproteobacteria bacterium]
MNKILCCLVFSVLSGTAWSEYIPDGKTINTGNGKTVSKFGNNMIVGSDGTTYQRFGNALKDSNGYKWQIFGNKIKRSDGKTCSFFGNQIKCNAPVNQNKK